jgi:hypothetical protein
MNIGDKIFDLINSIDDYKFLKYKLIKTLSEIIYLSLKYRYSYQIGLIQKREWINTANHLILEYYYDFDYRINHKDMEFFYEGEELKSIYTDVVKLLYYQGYHDIPEDLYKEFIKDKICIEDNNGKFINLLEESWYKKYARCKGVKIELRLID